MRVRRIVLSILVFGVLAAAWPAPASTSAGQSPAFVFEGHGLGHGVGLPLDGANQLAVQNGASATAILRRFYPGASLGTGRGLIRVLVGVRDDLRSGVVVELPQGGTVRDGRRASIAPSFPVRVPAGRRVKITFDGGFYRAEVLGKRSVSDTVEITGSSASTTPTTVGEPSTFPALAASPHSLWIQPARGGRLTFPPRSGADPRSFTGNLAVVVEAERMHLVDELDVETYLRGIDVSLPDQQPLDPAALEAAVIAARTYALRAASAEPKVGSFQLYSDERSMPYRGADVGDDALDAAVARTRGTILELKGEPIAALMCVSAGGTTATPEEVYGSSTPRRSYLRPVSYQAPDDYAWRVDLSAAELARRFGYKGEPTRLSVSRTGPSQRPVELRVDGSAGPSTFPVSEFTPALRLPSTSFRVRVEERTQPVPPRTDDSPPFQELPGEPLDSGAGNVSVSPARHLPSLPVLAAIAALVFAVLVFFIANLQRRVARRRARRAGRRSSGVPDHRPAPTIGPPALPPTPEPPAPPPESEPEHDRKEERRSPSPSSSGPVWHNEPDWLDDLLEPRPSTEDDHPDVARSEDEEELDDRDPATEDDHGSVARSEDGEGLDDRDPATEDGHSEVERPGGRREDGDDDVSAEEEPTSRRPPHGSPDGRPLRERLDWPDAPDWLDDG